MGKIRDVQIRHWINAGSAIAKSDGDGLTLTLSSGGTVSWVLRYRLHGKQRELTLGRYPDLTIAGARKLAMEKRVEVQQGVDVAREKQKSRLESANAWTFKQLADDYLKRASDSLAESTISGRRQQLRDYVHGRIGHLSAKEVSPRDIVDVVERSGGKSLHVARLVLIAIREVFAHGVARHVVQGNPCAHITAKAISGTPPKSRDRIMLSDEELVAAFSQLPRLGRQNALAAKILLATAPRIGELVNAKWVQVNFELKEWTVLKENAKTKTQFVIPMTDPVAGWFMELKHLSFDSEFVLPIRLRRKGREADRPMDETTLNAAFNRLHKRLGDRCRRFTPHDLRATARSHLGALGVSTVTAERCLNHSMGGLVAIYDKHDYLTERRRALELWNEKMVALARRGETIQ